MPLDTCKTQSYVGPLRSVDEAFVALFWLFSFYFSYILAEICFLVFVMRAGVCCSHLD